VNLLQTGNADTETMAFRLSEEYAKTEEKAKRLKSDIYELKQKNKEHLNEVPFHFKSILIFKSWKKRKRN
jgi:predicted nuclease with TOPRIM domain